jgi:hypothetical protein
MNHGVRLRALPFTARGGPDPGHPTRYSTFSPDPIRPKTGCATAATEHGRKSHPSPRQARSAWTPSLLPWHARPIHPRPSVNRSKDPNRRRRRAISQGRRGLPERGHEKETAPAVPFGVAVRLSFRRMLTVRKSIGGPPSGAMSTEGKRSLHEVLGGPPGRRAPCAERSVPPSWRRRHAPRRASSRPRRADHESPVANAQVPTCAALDSH